MLLDIRRHMELFDPMKFDIPITIIGGGATGSWVALFLAKLGIENITVYDFDTVESHNVPNQAFGLPDVGNLKVDALYHRIRQDTDIAINVKGVKYERQALRGIVFLMVDSMKERKRIYETSIKFNPNIKLFIEPRMGLSLGRIYTMEYDIDMFKKYEDTLYSDDDTEVSACGSSVSVITSSTMIASMCVRQLINWFNEVEIDNEIIIDMQYWNFLNKSWK